MLLLFVWWSTILIAINCVLGLHYPRRSPRYWRILSDVLEAAAVLLLLAANSYPGRLVVLCTVSSAPFAKFSLWRLIKTLLPDRQRQLIRNHLKRKARFLFRLNTAQRSRHNRRLTNLRSIFGGWLNEGKLFGRHFFLKRATSQKRELVVRSLSSGRRDRGGLNKAESTVDEQVHVQFKNLKKNLLISFPICDLFGTVWICDTQWHSVTQPMKPTLRHQ